MERLVIWEILGIFSICCFECCKVISGSSDMVRTREIIGRLPMVTMGSDKFPINGDAVIENNFDPVTC